MKKTKINAICFDMWGTLCEGGGQKQWDDLQKIFGAASFDKKTFLRHSDIATVYPTPKVR